MIPSYEPDVPVARMVGFAPVPDFWKVMVFIAVPVRVILGGNSENVCPAATLNVTGPEIPNALMSFIAALNEV